MTTDPNPGVTPAGETAEASRMESKAGSTTSAGRAGDQAQLPTDQAWVRILAANGSDGPEIRDDRVATIRSAIQKGTYKVSPDQTAEAILSHLTGQRDSAA